MKKVCVITGTRAEYGLLKPVIDRIYKSDELELQLVATGMHLSTEFGLTYKEIENDGYPITNKVEMLLSSDTPVGITKSMGVALIGFADCFDANKPDIAVILGDRYEMLVAATAAMVAGIPIAHIHGGELTEGAMDEAIRHSITKMSHLHFTTTEEYRRRVIQLGETPDTVYNVGALGVENVKTVSLLNKEELEKELGFQFTAPTFKMLLDAIDGHKDISVIFTKANADMDGRIINKMIDDYVSSNEKRCRAYTSLGQLKYLSTLQFCVAVVGNSSSGIIEVPSFKIPTVNIGDRQRGRMHAESVIDCGYDTKQIESALKKALSSDFRCKAANVKNPYEGENTSYDIVRIISEALCHGIDIKKKFYDLNVNP